jgi:hypothetical protein
MINQNERLYYRGTIFEVTYDWEGRIETHQSILVETHDEGFVFVVVQINEYDAGCIDGYIHLQFEHVNAVTQSFLQKGLVRQCYSNILKFQIITEDHSETIEEFLKFQKANGFWEDPLQPYNPNETTSPVD